MPVHMGKGTWGTFISPFWSRLCARKVKSAGRIKRTANASNASVTRAPSMGVAASLSPRSLFQLVTGSWGLETVASAGTRCVQIAGSKLVGPCGMHPFRGQSCRGRADHERPGSRRVFGAPPSPGSGSGSLSDFDENDRPPQAAEIREIRMTHQSPCHRETLCHRVTPCHPLLRPVGDHDLRHARPGPRLEPCASRILAPCRSSTVRLVRMKLHSWEKASGCAVSAVWSCAAAWGDFRRHHGVEEFWTPHSVRFSCR